jgi:hypothetical protein
MTALDDRPGILGRTEPRVFTPPLRELTPETSAGFSVIQFAEEILGIELLPWQRWFLIHALELRPDGKFRFRKVLCLVARQNGKTLICKVLALWFLYIRGSKLVLGAAQALTIAREAWQGAVDLATEHDELADEIVDIRYTNGEQCLKLKPRKKGETGGRYLITAATRGAGRGLSVDGLLLLDELREQRDWAAWAALSKTTNAKPQAIIVGISNQGDDESVVLNSLRSTALKEADPRLGLFEWSAPSNCRLDDPEAWAQANPGLGRTISAEDIASQCASDPAPVFKTEVLCQRVDALDAAIDPQGWAACGDSELSLEEVKAQVCVGVEVAYDDGHVTAMAAAPLGDGRIGLEVLDAWASTQEARVGLRELFARLHPRAVGWFPQGHGTVLGPDLQAMHGEVIGSRMYLMEDDMRPEAPGLVKIEQVPACEGLADLVDNRRLAHSDDQLTNAHVAASIRKDQGDGWRFARRGAGRNDAAYAAAGAVYLARTLPPLGDYDPLESVF